MSSVTGMDLRAVRRQFDRRARQLGQADFVHREIERRMLERLDWVRQAPRTMLDCGCGRGEGLMALGQRYPLADQTGVDLSTGMIRQARLRLAPDHAFGGSGRAGSWRDWFAAIGWRRERKTAPVQPAPLPKLLVADIQMLPFADSSFDLIWSNLVLHWCPDPGAAMAQWGRVLRAEGLLMFSTYGVDTLKELRAMGLPTARFPDLHDLGDALLHSGFVDPVMDMEQLTLTWSATSDALRDLRTLGGNALLGRAAGLRGRDWRRAILERLERSRNAQGQIALTLEIVYGHAWVGAASKLEPGTALVQFVRKRE